MKKQKNLSEKSGLSKEAFHLTNSNSQYAICNMRFATGDKRFALGIKRAIDIFGSALGLLLLSPLFLVVAVLVKRGSSGPAIFRQERVGKDSKHFIFYKFRSMVNNADDAAHREYIKELLQKDNIIPQENGEEKVFKMTNDNRVTRIGNLLRKTSIDELPQLFNVLKGEMSLIGPRPPIPYEVEMYEGWQMQRLSVLPGMTGLWQVKGRSRLGYKESIALDIEYIKSWSLWLDVKILFKTIPVVLGMRGVV